MSQSFKRVKETVSQTIHTVSDTIHSAEHAVVDKLHSVSASLHHAEKVVVDALHHPTHLSQARSAHHWVDEAIVLTRESVPQKEATLWQRLTSEVDIEIDGNFLLMEKV